MNKTSHPNKETTLNSIDDALQTFETLRAQYDPWYQFSDDHTVYLRHHGLRSTMTYLRSELGLWGQELTIPVCNFHGQLEYV